MSRVGIALAIVLAAVAAVLAACGGGATQTTTTTTTTSPTTTPTSTVTSTATSIDARGIYAANCAACHGPNRQGVQGLGGALTPASLASMSLDQVRDVITDGRAGTAMSGFKGRLAAEQIDAVAQHIKTVAP